MVAAIHRVWAVVPTVLLAGIAAFVLNPALYGRVFAIAAEAPTLAGATTVSAFQLGISITPVLAAASLARGAALTSVCLIGAALAAAAVPLILLDRARQIRSRRLAVADAAPVTGPAPGDGAGATRGGGGRSAIRTARTHPVVGGAPGAAGRLHGGSRWREPCGAPAPGVCREQGGEREPDV